jgi:hypothetical protein
MLSNAAAGCVLLCCVQVRGEMTTRRLDSLLSEDVLVRGPGLQTAMCTAKHLTLTQHAGQACSDCSDCVQQHAGQACSEVAASQR